ncbi:MAG: hypothetical protein RLZZ342_193 [Candidatus Parcubacteria bacterium]|jgi:mRNA interferase YafQ
MYRIFRASSFEKSFVQLKRSGKFKPAAQKDLEKAIDLLAADTPLPREYWDHSLSGVLSEYRECHIKGDTLLVYKKNKRELVLVLVDIGSHSYLFE